MRSLVYIDLTYQINIYAAKRFRVQYLAVAPRVGAGIETLPSRRNQDGMRDVPKMEHAEFQLMIR